MPFLSSVTITFATHDDNKNDSTNVFVFVKNQFNNSLSPEDKFDYNSNWNTLNRYKDPNDLGDGRQNPYLAYGIELGAGNSFDEGSSHAFDLTLTSDSITADQIVLPVVHIHMLADDSDRWIFDYKVKLAFQNNTSYEFDSTANGVNGIILDQDNRNHFGLGLENPFNTAMPVFPKAVTDSLLKKVILEFHTHDKKNWDTRLNVHVANRISADQAQDLVIGLDLFHDQEFPDSGSNPVLYRRVTWSADEGSLSSNTIRLADIVLPVVNIVIYPNDDDQWIFDYRITFEFGSPEDFFEKRLIYSSQTNGVILDQDNNKHSGAYHGTPFPTIAPATAPPLTVQPVDHTGAKKKAISLTFLNKKLTELINTRNGADGDDNPPLAKIRLNSGVAAAGVLPESYVDIRAIAAGKQSDAVSYGSNPTSINQLYQDEVGDAELMDIHSQQLTMSVEVNQEPPGTLRVDFAPFNASDLTGAFYVNYDGPVKIDNFSIALKLTLDLATSVTPFGHTQTVVDVMSWIPELQAMTVAFDHLENDQPYYRYTGTFLHQPVNLVSRLSIYELFVEQAIQVRLTTASALDPGGKIRQTIRNRIYDNLVERDVISKTSRRDSFNSTVTSWLLGGIADDPWDPDENNLVIEDISRYNANPELGIPEDMLVIGYRGPSKVFVPKAPADWPRRGHPNPAYDFSPGTLNNIEHIIVLTKENRSFDHVFGYLRLPVELGGMGRLDVDGLKGGEVNSYQGKDHLSFEMTNTRFAPGPTNDYESVNRAINGGQMDGFAKSQGEAYGDAVAGMVMGYYTGATVPIFDALARDFSIGHRWFASHPGPTFPNRYYELTGRPNLDTRGFWELENSSSIRPVFTPTIFDYLSAFDHRSRKPITWRYFEHGYCTLRQYERYTFDQTNIVDMDDPVRGFFTCASTGQLPNVSFIDPHFVDYPPGSNCDEPPSDMAAGQALVQSIVEAVIASPAWNNTLLLIVYDEHGGFYDHVAPPLAEQVSPELPVTTFGVRVPAIVISPWVAAGGVFGEHNFDHTSILKTIVRRFLSDNPPYMGARFAAAPDLAEVVGNQLRQSQFLPFIRYSIQFVESQMLLAVGQSNGGPGTKVLHLPGDGTSAQDFSFEDASNGFVYIRSHVKNLYVTVEVPVVVSGGAGDAVATPAAASGPGIILDLKYGSTQHVMAVGAKRPELQRWKLSSHGNSILNRNKFEISNQAYPSLLLQPADASQPGSQAVLGEASQSARALPVSRHVWSVTSPLVNDAPVITQ